MLFPAPASARLCYGGHRTLHVPLQKCVWQETLGGRVLLQQTQHELVLPQASEGCCVSRGAGNVRCRHDPEGSPVARVAEESPPPWVGELSSVGNSSSSQKPQALEGLPGKPGISCAFPGQTAFLEPWPRPQESLWPLNAPIQWQHLTWWPCPGTLSYRTWKVPPILSQSQDPSSEGGKSYICSNLAFMHKGSEPACDLGRIHPT